MEVELLNGERIDDLNDDGLKIIQKKDGFCFGIDAVLLYNFVKKVRKDAVIADLGTGTGVISILLATRNDVKKVYGIEIQEEMAEMARRSVELNGLENKIEIVNEDLVGMSERNWKKRFDVVVTNPPYKKAKTGIINENESKLISRHEVKCTLEDVVYEASKILKDNGDFYMVHRPDRLVDICLLMRENKIEPKEIRFVHPHVGDESNIVLIKGVKCGKAYLKVMNPVVIYEENSEK